MNETDQARRRLSVGLRRCLRQASSVDEPLDALLRITGARATGLWRLEQQELRLVGFRGVADMPDQVKTDFAAATQVVPLSQTGLGIVRAITDRAPAVSSVDEQEERQGGSPTWLRRFTARKSLAVPVHSGGHVVGTLAISTAQELRPDGDAWQVLLDVAAEIGEALVARQAGS